MTDKKSVWQKLYDWRSPEGYSMAVDEVALFFNNNTLEYAGKQCKPGMTKAEYQLALQVAGFSEEFAKLLVKRCYDTAIGWTSEAA